MNSTNIIVRSLDIPEVLMLETLLSQNDSIEYTIEDEGDWFSSLHITFNEPNTTDSENIIFTIKELFTDRVQDGI